MFLTSEITELSLWFIHFNINDTTCHRTDVGSFYFFSVAYLGNTNTVIVLILCRSHGWGVKPFLLPDYGHVLM